MNSYKNRRFKYPKVYNKNIILYNNIINEYTKCKIFYGSIYCWRVVFGDGFIVTLPAWTSRSTCELSYDAKRNDPIVCDIVLNRILSTSLLRSDKNEWVVL
jgi:hypothetical protein